MKHLFSIMSILLIGFKSFGQDTNPAQEILLTQFPQTKKWGYVHNESKTSRIFLPTRITATSAFDAVGLGTSLIWGNKERLEFNWAIPPQYDKAAKDFDENLACVVLDNKVGFIDYLNRFIIPPRYEGDELSAFRFGLAPVCREGKYGYIDKMGNMVIPNTFEWAGDFKENMTAPVKMNGKFGAIDLSGKLVVPCDYKLEEAMTTVPFSNKAYRQAVKEIKANFEAGHYASIMARLDSISAITDQWISDSAYVAPLPDYDPVRIPSGDRLGLKRSDNDTSWIFNPQYVAIDRLDESLYLLQTSDSLCGIGDLYGRIVIPCEYDNISLDPNSDVLVVEDNSLYGLYGRDGLLLSPTAFDLIGGFEAGKATVWIDLQQGLLNDRGDIEDDLVDRIFAQAEALEGQSKPNDARRLYRRIIRVEPTYAMAYHHLGLLELDREEYKSGLRLLSVANELDPENELIADDLKQAKKERRERRLERVAQGFEIAGAVVGVAATTYAAIEGGGSSTTTYQPASLPVATGYDGGGTMTTASDNSSANEAEAFALYQRMEDRVKQDIDSYQSHQKSAIVAGSLTLKNIQNAQRNMREHRSSCRKRGIIIPKSPWEDAKPSPNKYIYEKK